MSFSRIIDSYAWIEYFRASPEGQRAKEHVEGQGSATPTIVVAEMSRKLLREVDAGNETVNERSRRLEFIRASSQIIDLTFDIAAKAGEIDVEMKRTVKGWGLADSIVLATARSAGAKVVTGDDHFRGVQDVIFIKSHYGAAKGVGPFTEEDEMKARD